eukprot:5364313-Amphidinium_carterae.1
MVAGTGTRGSTQNWGRIDKNLSDLHKGQCLCPRLWVALQENAERISSTDLVIDIPEKFWGSLLLQILGGLEAWFNRGIVQLLNSLHVTCCLRKANEMEILEFSYASAITKLLSAHANACSFCCSCSFDLGRRFCFSFVMY